MPCPVQESFFAVNEELAFLENRPVFPFELNQEIHQVEKTLILNPYACNLRNVTSGNTIWS